MSHQIVINIPTGHCAGPDPTRELLERIMSTLQELEAKVASQTEQLSALRAYVTSIETQVRDLASGEVLSATVQAKVDALVNAIDANNAAIVAAGDGDLTT